MTQKTSGKEGKAYRTARILKPKVYLHLDLPVINTIIKRKKLEIHTSGWNGSHPQTGKIWWTGLVTPIGVPFIGMSLPHSRRVKGV